jgi:hypothetical protein
MLERICPKRHFIVYSKKSLMRRFPGTSYNLIGEIGDLTRKRETSPVFILETNTNGNCYPHGTHLPFIDRRIGYVLSDYEKILVLYQSRIPKFLRRKNL